MNDLLFSVVVPVYNVEDYLVDCVQSVINQHFSSCEIILVDDGSKDRSGQMCDQLAKKYYQVKVVHQKNGGLSAARNTGIKNSSGEYLVFLDSDDLLYKESLRNLEDAILEQGKPDFMISRRCTIQGAVMKPCQYHFDNEIIGLHNAVRIYKRIQTHPDCWLGTWIFSVKRSYCLDKNLFFYNGILHEDEEWVPRLFFNTNSIGFNNQILYCNRIDREGSITATPNIKREFDKLKIIDLLNSEFNKGEYTPEIRNIVHERQQQLLFGILCEALQYSANDKYRLLIQGIKEHRYILNNAYRSIYKMAQISLTICGVGITCRILAFIDSLKKGHK